MLPDLRSLFATVILSVSVLVFGLGAAALFRTAHGNFSNLPSANVPHETNLARDQEARTTTLALLRVEMIADQNEHTNSTVVTSTPEAARAEPESTPAPRTTHNDATNDSGTVQTPADSTLQAAATANAEPQPVVVANAPVTPDASDVTTPAEPVASTQAVAVAEPTVPQSEQTAKASGAMVKSRSHKARVAARVRVKPHRIARARQHVIAQRTISAAPQATQQAPFNAPFAGFGTK